MSDYRELIQYNGLLFQGYFAYESQEYDEPLPGWSGHWNSQQDKQHEQFRVRQPQQKLAKHNMYAKAATFSTAFYCEQVRCLLILCILVILGILRFAFSYFNALFFSLGFCLINVLHHTFIFKDSVTHHNLTISKLTIRSFKNQFHVRKHIKTCCQKRAVMGLSVARCQLL